MYLKILSPQVLLAILEIIGQSLRKNKINLKSFLKKSFYNAFCRSSDFVKIVEFLCSDENKFTMGSNFIMDGGYIK